MTQVLETEAASELEMTAAYPWVRPAEAGRRAPAVAGRRRVAASELMAFDGEAFVVNAYRVLLQRDPEGIVLHRTLVELEDGLPKGLLLARLRGSVEGRALGVEVPGLGALRLESLAAHLRRKGAWTLLKERAAASALLLGKVAARALPRRAAEAAPAASSAAGSQARGFGTAAPRLLSICVTTYNRAEWLAHSLPLLLERTRPFADKVEVVVCDNASTDRTPEVVTALKGNAHLRYHRNEKNVGMVGNLVVSAEQAAGRYVWLLGDDDLLLDGALARILPAIEGAPESELFYLNYAVTECDRPERVSDIAALLRAAHPVSAEFRDARTPEIRTIAAKSENCFTGIYCMIFRADHARQAFTPAQAGPAFRSLPACVPTADYVVRRLFRRPGVWIGTPCVVVNLNVSWLRYASLFILERFPELFDLMQEQGADPADVDGLRSRHVPRLQRWMLQIHVGAQRANLDGFSLARLESRFARVPSFQRVWRTYGSFYRILFALSAKTN